MAFDKLLMLLLLLPFVWAVDPCAILATKPSYDSAAACLNSFPFNASLFEDTIDSISKVIPLNVFVDTAKSSPDQIFQQNYDIVAEIENLKAKNDWKNDREWQEALSLAFLKMNDAHTTYTPGCYRRLLFTQRFYPVAAVTPSGQTKIYIAGSPYSQDKIFLGLEIVRIEDKPALEFLWDYAQNFVGKFKDAGTRFNDVMATMTWDAKNGWVLWGGSWASTTRLPPKKTVRYVLKAKDGKLKTVEHPWHVSLPTRQDLKFSNKEEYWGKICASRDNFEDESYDARASGDSKDNIAVKVGTDEKQDNENKNNEEDKNKSNEEDKDKDESKPEEGKGKGEGKQEEEKGNDKSKKEEEDQSKNKKDDKGKNNEQQKDKDKGKKEGEDRTATKNRPRDHEDLLLDEEVYPQRVVPRSSTDFVSPKSVLKPIIKHEGLAFYQLKDEPIGVLAITTFSLEHPRSKTTWRETMAEIIKKFKGCCKKLILDLSGNGGGYLDLAWETIAVLTPDPTKEFPMINKRYLRDFRACPLQVKLIETVVKKNIKNSPFFPSWFGIPGSTKPYQGVDIINPTRSRPLDKEGKDTVKYSKLFQEFPINSTSNPLKDKSFGIKSEDIFILSSGECGSACGLVALHLREVDGVQAAALGYFKDRPRTFATFPITEVFTLNQILSEIERIGLKDNSVLPKKLKVDALVRIPVREGYSQVASKKNVPSEFLWISADLNIDNDDFTLLRPDRVWGKLADTVGWCKKSKESKFHANMKPDRPIGKPPPDNVVTGETEIEELYASSASKRSDSKNEK